MTYPSERPISLFGPTRHLRTADLRQPIRQERPARRKQRATPLWLALCVAPEEGTDIAELMRVTGWKRTKLYRHLQQHAEAGRAIRVSGGRWRARTPEDRAP